MSVPEEGHLELLRRKIEESYLDHPTGCGGSFGEILCHEIHTRGMTFAWLAQKWGVSLPTLGELIWDHCKRLEPLPKVQHSPIKRRPGTTKILRGAAERARKDRERRASLPKKRGPLEFLFGIKPHAS